MVLWLSTDFGDFRTFWWGSHPKCGCFPKRDKNFATDDKRFPSFLQESLKPIYLQRQDIVLALHFTTAIRNALKSLLIFRTLALDITVDIQNPYQIYHCQYPCPYCIYHCRYPKPLLYRSPKIPQTMASIPTTLPLDRHHRRPSAHPPTYEADESEIRTFLIQYAEATLQLILGCMQEESR